MFVIIVLIIFLIGLFFVMQNYKNTSKETIPNHLSKEIEVSETYLSRMIQEHFYNLNTKRLTREEFQYIIDKQNDEQAKMFLNYMLERYYGVDSINMKYIPFSTLIEDASHYSGYRLEEKYQ